MRRDFYCGEMKSYPCCSDCHSEWGAGKIQPLKTNVGRKVTIVHCCGQAGSDALKSRKFAAKLIREARADHRKPYIGIDYAAKGADQTTMAIFDNERKAYESVMLSSIIKKS